MTKQKTELNPEVLDYLQRIPLPSEKKTLMLLVQDLKNLDAMMIIFDRCGEIKKDFIKEIIVNRFHELCEKGEISLDLAIDFFSKNADRLKINLSEVLLNFISEFIIEKDAGKLPTLERLSLLESIPEDIRTQLQLKVYLFKMSNAKRENAGGCCGHAVIY